MTPRNRALRRAGQLLEKIEHRNLIGQGFVDGPAGCRVGGSSERKAVRQHIGTRNRVAYVLSGIGATWCHKTMTIKKKGTVPVGWNFDEVSGAIGQAARVRGDAGLGVRGRRERQAEHGNCRQGEKGIADRRHDEFPLGFKTGG